MGEFRGQYYATPEEQWAAANAYYAAQSTEKSENQAPPQNSVESLGTKKGKDYGSSSAPKKSLLDIIAGRGTSRGDNWTPQNAHKVVDSATTNKNVWDIITGNTSDIVSNTSDIADGGASMAPSSLEQAQAAYKQAKAEYDTAYGALKDIMTDVDRPDYQRVVEEARKNSEAALAQLNEAKAALENAGGTSETSWGKMISNRVETGSNNFLLGLAKGADFLVGDFVDEGRVLADQTARSLTGGKYGLDLESGSLLDRFIRNREAHGAALEEHNKGHVGEGDKAAQAVSKYTPTVVQAIPQAVFAILTAGASTGAEMTAAGLQEAALLANSSKAAQVVIPAAKAAAAQLKDPQWALSFVSTVGNDYEEALNEGATESQAAVYALLTSGMNATIEVGGADEALGGLQKLPKSWQSAIEAGNKNWLLQLIKSAGSEVAEEIEQGIVSAANKGQYRDVSAGEIFDPARMAEEAKGAAITSMILGGGQMAVTNALNSKAQKAAAAQQQAAPAAQQASPAATGIPALDVIQTGQTQETISPDARNTLEQRRAGIMQRMTDIDGEMLDQLDSDDPARYDTLKREWESLKQERDAIEQQLAAAGPAAEAPTAPATTGIPALDVVQTGQVQNEAAAPTVEAPTVETPAAETAKTPEQRKAEIQTRMDEINAALDAGNLTDEQTDALMEEGEALYQENRALDKQIEAQGIQQQRVDAGEVSKGFGTPENHIDNRKPGDVSKPSVKAFQFDHPELHEHFVGAAQALMDEVQAAEMQTSARTGQKGSAVKRGPVRTLMDMGLTKPQIMKCLSDIIANNGQENYAAAKKVEIVLSDMMSNGWTGMNGQAHDVNTDYITAKDAIDGGVKADSWEKYLADHETVLALGEVTEEQLRAEWEAQHPEQAAQPAQSAAQEAAVPAPQETNRDLSTEERQALVEKAIEKDQYARRLFREAKEASNKLDFERARQLEETARKYQKEAKAIRDQLEGRTGQESTPTEQPAPPEPAPATAPAPAPAAQPTAQSAPVVNGENAGNVPPSGGTATAQTTAESTQPKAPFTTPEGLNTTTEEREGRFSSNTLAKNEKTADVPKEQRSRFTYMTKSEAQSVSEAAARLGADRAGEVQKLMDAEAWSGAQTDMAAQIANDLYRNGDTEAYAAWKKVMNAHAIEGGRGIQAWAKYTRGDGQSAFSEVTDAVNANENLTPEQKTAILEKAKNASEKLDAALKDVAEAKNKAGDGGKAEAPESLISLIKEISAQRNTGTIFKKNLDRLLNSQKGNVDYLSALAYNQILAMSNDYTQQRSLAEYVKTIQTLAQLTAFATFNRNIGGNFSFGGVDTLAKDAFGIAFDKLISKATGKRAVTVDKSWFSSDARKGALDGMQKSALEVALDVDMNGGESVNRYDQNGGRTFKMTGNAVERFFSRWEQLLNYSLTTSDKFSRGAIEAENARGLNALENNGLTEQEIADIGEAEADYRLFQNKGIAYRFSKGIHDVFNVFGFGGEGDTAGQRVISRATGRGGFGVGDIVNTYPGVPANLGVKALEYSPANIVKGGAELLKIWHDAKTGKSINAVSQYNAVMDTARGLAGTPIIALFAAMCKAGLIKNWDDEEDPDVKALNAAEGKRGIQFNLSGAQRWLDGGTADWQDGDTLDSIGYLEPMNAFMAIGSLVAGLDDDATKADYARAYATGAIQSFLDIPVMSNLADMIDTYNYSKAEDIPGKAGEALLNYAGNAATGFVPAPIRAYAKGKDEYYRDTSGETVLDSIANSFKATIPGKYGRESLPVKLDNFGNPKMYGGTEGERLFNSLINPGERTTIRQSEESVFLEKLREETGDAEVVPDRKAPNTIKVGEENVRLTPEEKQAYQETAGQRAQQYVREMMDDDLFTSLSPDEQALVVKELYKAAEQEAKEAFLEGREAEGGKTDYAKLLAGKYEADGDVARPPLGEANIPEYIAFDTALKNATKNGDYDEIGELFGNFAGLDPNTQEVLAAQNPYARLVLGLKDGAPALHAENVGEYAQFDTAAKKAAKNLDYTTLEGLFGNFGALDPNTQEVLAAQTGTDVGRVAKAVIGTERPGEDIPPLDPENVEEYFGFKKGLSSATKKTDYSAIDDFVTQWSQLPANAQEVIAAEGMPDHLKGLLTFQQAGSGSESYYKLYGAIGDVQEDEDTASRNAHVKLTALANADLPDEEKDELIRSGAMKDAFQLSKTATSTYEILRGAGFTPEGVAKWFTDADWYASGSGKEPEANGSLNAYEVAAGISRIPGLTPYERSTLYMQFKQALQKKGDAYDTWKNKSYRQALTQASQYGRTVNRQSAGQKK